MESKCLVKAFSACSNLVKNPFSSNLRSFSLHWNLTLGFLNIEVINFLKFLSWTSNSWVSFTNFCLISSLPTKILSKYIHFFCTSTHTSIISIMLFISCSKSSISFLNALACLLAPTFCKFSILSLIISISPETSLNLYPLSSFPLLWGANWNFNSSNEFLISSNLFFTSVSSLASFTIVATLSFIFNKSSFITSLKVITSNLTLSLPVLFSLMNSAKFLSFTTGDFSKRITSLTLSLNSSRISSNFLYGINEERPFLSNSLLAFNNSSFFFSSKLVSNFDHVLSC